MIEVKNLQKAFGGNMVLKGVTETIEKGEKIAIIGPSGSGKSTFLRCLNRLEEPTGGEIWFEGKDITAKDCDINRIRRKMGMVFQHFNLFPHLTVKQNITLAPVNLKLQTQAEAESPAAESWLGSPVLHPDRPTAPVTESATTAIMDAAFFNMFIFIFSFLSSLVVSCSEGKNLLNFVISSFL